jgi:hypothetical protein
MLADDDDELLTTAVKSQGSQQPAWMRTLFERCREWLGELPEVCALTAFYYSLVFTLWCIFRNLILWPNKHLNIKIHCIACSLARAPLAANC